MGLEIEIEKKLRGFTLQVAFAAESEPVGILGASGAGKTMTLRTIAGTRVARTRPDRAGWTRALRLCFGN